MLQNIWNVFLAHIPLYLNTKIVQMIWTRKQFKCGSVELFLSSSEQEIVLSQPNHEIIHTFKLFVGSVELFIFSFELLAAAFRP